MIAIFTNPLHADSGNSRLAIAVVIVLLMAACGEQIRPLPPLSDQPISTDTRQVEALEAQNEPAEAALRWLQLARQAPPDESTYLLLRAADAWLIAGERGEAEQILTAIEADRAPPEPRAQAWMSLVSARLALMDGDSDEALRLLEQIPARIPNRLDTRVQQLERNLDLVLNNPDERTLDTLPAPGTGVSSTGQMVRQIRQLDRISLQRLQQAIRSSNPDTAAWAALAAALRQNLFEPEDATIAALDRWQQRYRIDGLSRSDLGDLAQRYRDSFQPPLNVALLLPLSGNLSGAGELIQHGFLSAALEAHRPGTVEVFDTGSSASGARTALFSAREQRMTQIVGPIGRSQVQALAEIPGQTIPILALNQPEDLTRISLDVLGQFASLGLIPEDEARAAAAYASEAGFQRALVVVEADSLGPRLAQAFSDAFEQAGGRVGYTLDLPASTRDYSALLGSAIRQARPDVVFLATGASAARVVKPQLKFIDADDIQVMATSQIYNGPTNARSDRDINGTWLTWTPWLMNESTGSMNLAAARELLDGIDSPTQLSLFALGADAWGVLPYLDLLRESASLVYPGLTGMLRVDADGHLRRTPALVEIRGGRPQPLSLNLSFPGPDADASPQDR